MHVLKLLTLPDSYDPVCSCCERLVHLITMVQFQRQGLPAQVSFPACVALSSRQAWESNPIN